MSRLSLREHCRVHLSVQVLLFPLSPCPQRGGGCKVAGGGGAGTKRKTDGTNAEGSAQDVISIFKIPYFTGGRDDDTAAQGTEGNGNVAAAPDASSPVNKVHL